MDCPSCGAPIEITNRFSKVIVCQYCGTHSTVGETSLEAGEKHAKLADFPSIFSVGTEGSILDKSFRALGRIRYDYGDGHYDEWFLEYDGEPAWFTEDEGTYTLFTETDEVTDISVLETARPGQTVDLNGRKIMVKEKGKAHVKGAEGELLFYVEPGTEVTYVDGVWDGKKVSVEYSEEEMEIFIGRNLLSRDIRKKE